MDVERKYAIGTQILPKGVNFRVYAPESQKIEVGLEKSGEPIKFFSLDSEGNGYYSKSVDEFSKNDLYRFKLEGRDALCPDPASRFQPQGPLGPSQVIDPNEYKWTDQDWKGVSIENQIIYEMHIGTFTQEGTYAAAQKELKELAELGITVIEIMPVSDFPGKFGWGYDGVNLFAPTRLYGSPDELKNFINEAHKLNLAVILDVVYNHFGPAGNFLPQFFKDYFLKENNDWGAVVNFEHSESRKYFLENVRYWIEEYHFDGLRIDAIHGIKCESRPHILQEIAEYARKSGGQRKIIIIGENEKQNPDLIRTVEQEGYGFDAAWNDDFHHSAIVRLTGSRDAYYKDYTGTAQEFISSAKYGYLYQGQYYVWQKQCRGGDLLDSPHTRFVNFIQNHDQIANSGISTRIHTLTDFGNFKAMTALFLLLPSIPLIFQGQEFASSSPFYYFADYSDELGKEIEKGRKEFLAQFQNLATEEMQAIIMDSGNPVAFIKSKLNFTERQTNEHIYNLHKDLIKLRKTDSVFSYGKIQIDGAVLNRDAFIIRFFGEDKKNQRLLVVNFGVEFEFNPSPEPLLAPPQGYLWDIIWHSESPRYNGSGVPPFLGNKEPWLIRGHQSFVLAPCPIS